MKSKFLCILSLSALTLLSCNNSNSKAEDTTSNETSTIADPSAINENGMKKHEDNHLSFEYPKEWSLDLLNLESSFEKATQYSLKDANGADIVQFSIDSPSSYTLGKNSIDEFLDYNNPDNQEILAKESFKTSTGENVYYLVLKRTDDYHNDIRILLPGTEKYEINGLAHNRSEAYDSFVKNGDVVNVLKSIAIKVK